MLTRVAGLIDGASRAMMLHIGGKIMRPTSKQCPIAPGEELIGQQVQYRDDPRWRGLVVGTTSLTVGRSLLQVLWSRPERFIGLSEANALQVINDPTMKDRP